LNPAPVVGGPSAYVLSKTTIGWAVWPRRRAPGAAGNQHQLAAQGNLTSQLTRIGKRRFLGIGRACGVLRIVAFVAHLANRVIGGALGCCRRGWKRKRAGFGVSGCTGSPLRRWGEAAEFAGVFRRNREPDWLHRGEKAQRRLVEWQKLVTGVKIGQRLPAVRRSAG